MGTAWVETGHVFFTQEDGSRLHPGKATDLFQRLVAASGLPPIRLHDLRHGAATLMLAADIDIKIMSDTLGHSDTRITRDTYPSVLPHISKSAPPRRPRSSSPSSAGPRPRRPRARPRRRRRPGRLRPRRKAKAQAKAAKKATRRKPKK
ncbi:tyrosine-type recombinase/integrase [Streptomyces sp. NPDC006267]|uniref:tyrosine-type recombinase/integrase n=1 Tax=Streptomyces sp. NPDC006267 TaxID=3157173 RepID=UPI0033A5424C